jgi:protein farnesyltransferase subunit beta
VFLCVLSHLMAYKTLDPSLYPEETACKTLEDQLQVENIVRTYYEGFQYQKHNEETIELSREKHIDFLLKGLEGLGEGYSSLDASRTWLVFWILHSLEILNFSIPNDIRKRGIDFLRRCQNPTGGFGGGPGQLSHLAPTYSAVSALMILGSEEAYNVIDRDKMYQFLYRMKLPNGAFSMHEDGESDLRAIYCAVTVATLLNILTPELIAGTAEWIASCQTYEGGLGGEPGNEAHGGVTYCGLAALILLNKTELIDINRLLKWTIARQMRFEGGFQGRSNKLVDSCYSFWVGALFPLIYLMLNSSNYASPTSNTKVTSNLLPMSSLMNREWLFDQIALQKYILLCCQEKNGGLRDKPEKTRDFYHTCYALSGLSIAQHNPNKSTQVLGMPSNLLKETDPIFNLCPDTLNTAFEYFNKLPSLKK